MTEHKEVCLSINGAQSIRLEKEKRNLKIILNKYQLHLNFLLILSVSYTQKKNQDHITYSFTYKLVCVDDKFSKAIVIYRGKNAAFKFLEAILTESEYCKKVMKKHFHKYLIMAEDEEQFQSSNTSWICEKLIENDHEKVRDHCHMAGKFRGAAHWSCNI